ncbi:hypothetical protein [Aquibacillus salsiterrae]|uniref:Uncharacterized protein n=1 Tax=Aquibacillus salsiterrae TaxID=2950439 RepID=A0A9X4AFX3_9BACI|nr:hypothetical protein [Aquibacillus salsiterrae]MDC3418477.1 hypothetical protein [Aquibacillus salsiterrae]
MVAQSNKIVQENHELVQENSKMIKVLTGEAKRDRDVNEVRHKELLKKIINIAYDIDLCN